MAEIYTGLNEKKYTVGRKIGQGGEGAVFEINEDPSLVAKIYTDPLDSAKTEKIVFMTSMVSAELLKFAAWPVDVLKDRNRRFCGLVMRKLQAFVPLHKLFSPMDRKKLFPDKGYNFLVHVARNLAISFHKIHQLGIVAGDVNEANILVDATGMVALIDCDSFQIKNNTRYYFCEVGIPRYTPPELLEKGSFANVVRTVSTDNFSLATLIFQLLFLGRAPFTGINPGSQEIDEETAIKTREFAYSTRRLNKKLFPAKHTLDLNSLPKGIASLFHDAFESVNGQRPTAAQWVDELGVLAKELTQCVNSKIHYYPKTMQQCPWCFFERQFSILYFLDDSYLKGIAELADIEKFINGFKVENLEIKKLIEYFPQPNLQANVIDRRFYRFRNINRALLGAIAVVAVVLCFVINVSMLLAGAILILILNTMSPPRKSLKAELTRRQNYYNGLQGAFQAVIKQHNNPGELKKYNQSAGKLTEYIRTFKQLPAEFNANKKRIEEKYYNRKYAVHLQQFDIRDHAITTFGPAKKLLIYNNGIRTAADISKLNKIKIAGIGPKNIQILFAWQRQIGAGFTYVPDTNVIAAEINIATREILNKRLKLETDIKEEYKALAVIKANVLASSQATERTYNDLSHKLYQAELDLNAFKNIMV